MNEREEFLQSFRSAFVQMAERLDTMTESQVLEGILQVKAARRIYEKEFAARMEALAQAAPPERPRVAWAAPEMYEALVSFASMQAFFDSAKKLRLQAGGKHRARATSPFDSLEDALHDRLELLRNGPGDDGN